MSIEGTLCTCGRWRKPLIFATEVPVLREYVRWRIGFECPACGKRYSVITQVGIERNVRRLGGPPTPAKGSRS